GLVRRAGGIGWTWAVRCWNARGLKVGDAPGIAGKPLVHAGIAEAAGERLAIRYSIDLGKRGDNGHLANQLNLLLGHVHRVESQRAIAHAVEELLLGATLAVGGDAEKIVGEQLVHGGDIASQLRAAPLPLKRLNMRALHAL